MNFRTLFFAVASAIGVSASALPILDIALVDQGNGNLEVRFRPDENFDGVFSGIVFTIRWEVASGATLGNENQVSPIADYIPVTKSGPETDDGTYRYQPFVGFGFSSLATESTSWVAGVEYVLCIIPVLNGVDLFEIVNDSWTASNNADYFVSLNGSNQTGIIYGNPAMVVEGTPIAGISVQLQPNPATEVTVLTISAMMSTVVNAQLCDPAGRTVWQQDVAAFSGTRKENIHLSTLSAGTYMLHLRTNEGLRTERLVIQ